MIARPERVAFGLSLTSSLSESQIDARMTSLESSPWNHCHTHHSLFHPFHYCQHFPCYHLCQCPGISQCWLASSERIRCCKQCLTITFTFSLFLLFECYLSPWWFKYLFFVLEQISFLSLVTSSHSLVQG